MTSFKVSVIIPTYNRSSLLNKTLQSILEQKIQSEFIEVIVSDDGSSDDTLKVIKKFEKKINLQYLFQADKGRRLSLARNNAILKSCGDLCLFIDSGIILNKNCIQNHLNKFYEYSTNIVSIGYVYGFSHYEDGNVDLKKVLDANYKYIDLLILFLKEHNLYLDMRTHFFDKYNLNLTDIPAPWVFFWTGNVMVPRKLLIDLNLFDLNYDPNWGMEDIDLGYRLFKRGIKYILTPEAETIHYPHEKNMNINHGQNKINEKYFFSKFSNEETELYLKVGWELNDVLIPKT